MGTPERSEPLARSHSSWERGWRSSNVARSRSIRALSRARSTVPMSAHLMRAATSAVPRVRLHADGFLDEGEPQAHRGPAETGPEPGGDGLRLDRIRFLPRACT